MPRTPRSPSVQAAGSDMAATIARLRQLAARSADSPLLADGPPHPDAELLSLAGEALDGVRAAERMECRSRADVHAWSDVNERNRKLLRRAGRLTARTPAGIYAKVLLVRASRTGAACLARSLADDLVAQPALRASLWPAAPAEDGA